jgi:hypothetical protein
MEILCWFKLVEEGEQDKAIKCLRGNGAKSI